MFHRHPSNYFSTCLLLSGPLDEVNSPSLHSLSKPMTWESSLTPLPVPFPSFVCLSVSLTHFSACMLAQATISSHWGYCKSFLSSLPASSLAASPWIHFLPYCPGILKITIMCGHSTDFECFRLPAAILVKPKSFQMTCKPKKVIMLTSPDSLLTLCPILLHILTLLNHGSLKPNCLWPPWVCTCCSQGLQGTYVLVTDGSHSSFSTCCRCHQLWEMSLDPQYWIRDSYVC